MEEGQAVYTRQGERTSRHVTLSVPTMVLGVMAVSLATAAVTMSLSRSPDHSTTMPKFVPTAPAYRHRAARLHAEGEAAAGEAPKPPEPPKPWEVENMKIDIADTLPSSLSVDARMAAQSGGFVQPGETPGRKSTGFFGKLLYPFGSTGQRGKVSGKTPKELADEMNAAKPVGVLPPMGYLDPWGFGLEATAERMRWFREAELKHGRIAMLAAVGFLWAENPALQKSLFPDAPTPPLLASHSFTEHTAWSDAAWATVVTTIGILEHKVMKKSGFNALDWKLSPDYEIGDLGFDPLTLKPTNPDSLKEMQNKEVQNGRLAMLAIAGFNAQEMVDNKPISFLGSNANKATAVIPMNKVSLVNIVKAPAIKAKAAAAKAAAVATPAAGASELVNEEHVQKGLELVKELGQMLMDTQTPHA